MRAFVRPIWAFVVLLYVFWVAFALANLIVDRLWLIGYWAVLAPVLAILAWMRVRPTTALFAYVILTFAQYIAVTLATHGTFNGEAQQVDWYTPLIATAIYGGLICVLNFIPMAALFGVICVLKSHASERAETDV
jgi:hypothetical protein